MKRIIPVLSLWCNLLLLLLSCSYPTSDLGLPTTTSTDVGLTSTPFTNNNSEFDDDITVNSPPIITPAPSKTPTKTPTLTSTPKPYDTQRFRIQEIMEQYNLNEKFYLRDFYWEELSRRIDTYGVAQRITTLEYHGNNYWMYDGAYSMTPEVFYKQMDFLMQNDFHFVTLHELRGFLEGYLDLPLRSIILTSDLGYSSQESIPSMIVQFSELEEIYGYKPHMQSYIWTQYMTPEETSICKEDACWENFRFAKYSGYFTFGTHSETHPVFEEESLEFTKEDLELSIVKINENLGLNVYAITWPFESCSPFLNMLDEIGIFIGFGGRSKPIQDAYTYKQDDMRLCLPRLFPPHGGGFSARPSGKTLQEMLEAQMGQPIN